MRKKPGREPRTKSLKQNAQKQSKYGAGNVNPKAAGTTNKPNKGFGSHPKKPAKFVRKGSFKGDNAAANNGETGPNMQSKYRR